MRSVYCFESAGREQEVFMFETGDFVSKVSDGICRILQISEMSFGGSEKREYYVLEPLAKAGNRVFVPVENAEKRIRPVMTRAEALQLVERIPALSPILVENEKQRERQYHDALQSNSPEQWAQVIKTIYVRREERMAAGKKNTAMDERYFKIAEDCLYSELELTLGEDHSAVFSRIKSAAENQ